jgi:APA family basic amino acid/polyamine antiporter
VTNLAYLYVLPVEQMAGSKLVAADAMQRVLGTAGAAFISALVILSTFGTTNGTILASARVYFAMARDGMFFKRIAECHPKFLTPHVSIVAITVWSVLLTLTGTFKQLFTYVIFGEWIFFGMTVAAVIVLRRKRPDLQRPYKTWGYPVTPVLFVLAAVYVAVGSLMSSFRNAMFGLLIICLGIPAYLYWKAKLDKAPTT